MRPPHLARCIHGALAFAALHAPAVALADDAVATAPEAVAPAPPLAPSTVSVHMPGAADVTLEREQPAEWTTICAAPCDIPVRTGSHYRVVGGGIEPSAPFFVYPQDGDSVTVHVRRGAVGWFATKSPPSPSARTRTSSNALMHLDGADMVNVEQERPADWTSLCSAPCALQLSPEHRYRVAVGGAAPSRPFVLQFGPGAQEMLEVHRGSTAQRVVGIIMVPLGATSLLVGPAFLAEAAFVHFYDTSADTSGLTAAGWGLIGGGALALALGVFLIVDSKTVVAQRLYALDAPSPLRGELRPAGGEPRRWFTPPQAASVPLVDVRF